LRTAARNAAFLSTHGLGLGLFGLTFSSREVDPTTPVAVRGRRRSSDSRSDLAGLNAASSRDGDASGFHDALTGATGAPECR